MKEKKSKAVEFIERMTVGHYDQAKFISKKNALMAVDIAINEVYDEIIKVIHEKRKKLESNQIKQ